MLKSLKKILIEMNKLLLMPFFVLSTLIPNAVYANSERRQFVNVCSNELVEFMPIELLKKFVIVHMIIGRRGEILPLVDTFVL